jgi:hypothetical protein
VLRGAPLPHRAHAERAVALALEKGEAERALTIERELDEQVRQWHEAPLLLLLLLLLPILPICLFHFIMLLLLLLLLLLCA